MLKKLKKLWDEHPNEVALAAFITFETALVLAVIISYKNAGKGGLPKHISAAIFERDGIDYLKLNDVLYKISS